MVPRFSCQFTPNILTSAVIEHYPWVTTTTVATSYDERVIALNYTSKQILQGIGAWQIAAAQSEPIKHIHVSEQGGFGFTRLDAQQLGLPALGYVISANQLLQSLQAVITQKQHPTLAFLPQPN
ncbi:MAG: hypothetical protein R3E08_11585 [Thiotrichaceae bacterium]